MYQSEIVVLLRQAKPNAESRDGSDSCRCRSSDTTVVAARARPKPHHQSSTPRPGAVTAPVPRAYQGSLMWWVSGLWAYAENILVDLTPSVEPFDHLIPIGLIASGDL